MTPSQRVAFRWLVRTINVTEFHHGDCVGADEQAHEIVCEESVRTHIVIHPPTDSKARAYCVGNESLLARPYLKRNEDIVLQSRMLIAAPQTCNEVLRSGTWSTVRKARKKGRLIYVLYP
jgi:hypothetical protein